MPSLGGWEFVILVGVLVLLFGAKKLPTMAKSIGQSMRVFKKETSALRKDGSEESDADQQPAPQQPYTQQPAQQQPYVQPMQQLPSAQPTPKPAPQVAPPLEQTQGRDNR